MTSSNAALNERLTSDAMYNGRLLTRSEYRAHMALLREISTAPAHNPTSSWRATTLSDEESVAWIALHQSGLVRQYAQGSWNVIVVSEYGQVYLRQRAHTT
jgi:hypothetical protein